MKLSVDPALYLPLQLALKALDTAESIRRQAALTINTDLIQVQKQDQAEADEKYGAEVVALTLRVVVYCVYSDQQWRNDNSDSLIPSTESLAAFMRGHRLRKFRNQNEIDEGRGKKFLDDAQLKRLDGNVGGGITLSDSFISRGSLQDEAVDERASRFFTCGGSSSQDTPSTPSERKYVVVQNKSECMLSTREEKEALSPSSLSVASSSALPYVQGYGLVLEPSVFRIIPCSSGIEVEATDKQPHSVHTLATDVGGMTSRNRNSIKSNNAKPKALAMRTRSDPIPQGSTPIAQSSSQKTMLIDQISDILLRICDQVDSLRCRKPNYYGSTFQMGPLNSELAMLKARASNCLDRLSSRNASLVLKGNISSGRNAPIIEGDAYGDISDSTSFQRSPTLLLQPQIQEITGRVFWEDMCCRGSQQESITWEQFSNALERVYGMHPVPAMKRLKSALGSRNEISNSHESGPATTSTTKIACTRGRACEQNTLQKLRKLCLSPSRRKRKTQIHRWMKKSIPTSGADDGTCSCPIKRDAARDGSDDKLGNPTIVSINNFSKFCTDHKGLYEGVVAVTDPGTYIECMGSVEDLAKEDLMSLAPGEPNVIISHNTQHACSIKPMIIRELLGIQILQLSCGGQHAAILAEGGDVFTWGKGGFGRLGHGDSRPTSSPKKVLIPHSCSQVACGFAYTAVVTSCGQVYAWGAGENGRLGVGDEHDRNLPTRVLLPIKTKIDSVYAGSVHTCVLSVDGEVYSFGKHEYTGHGSSNDIFVPKKLDAFSSENIEQMSVGPGGYHTIALTKNTGKVYTWGHNRVGQLGFPISDQTSLSTEGGYFIATPTWVKSTSSFDVSKVVAGWGHSAFVTRRGEVYTCGRNFQGQLGLGEPDFSTVNERGHPYQSCFVRVLGELSAKQVTQFACGGEHSVALTKEGELYAFGKGHKGQLGLAAGDNKYLPARVDRFGLDGRQTLQVACGNNCTLVLRGKFSVPSLFELCRQVVDGGDCLDDAHNAHLHPIVSSILDLQHDLNDA